jgi:hypothetical protein
MTPNTTVQVHITMSAKKFFDTALKLEFIAACGVFGYATWKYLQINLDEHTTYLEDKCRQHDKSLKATMGIMGLMVVTLGVEAAHDIVKGN